MADKLTAGQLLGIIKLDPDWLKYKVRRATNADALDWVDPIEAIEAYRLVFKDLPTIERVDKHPEKYAWRVRGTRSGRSWLCNHIANGAVAVLMMELLGDGEAQELFKD